jgi:hypothetical protein
MLDDFDLDIPEEDDLDDFLADDGDDEEGGGGGGNRRFMIIAGAIGGFIILSLLCLWIFNLVSDAGEEADAVDTVGTANAQQTMTEEAFEAALGTATNTPTSDLPSATEAPTETETPEPSATSPSIASPTNTAEGGPTADPRTATVQALLTQAALAQTQVAVQILTFTPTSTPAALPDAGFFDDYNAQSLFILTGVLLLVIIFAQRMRAANAER